MQASACAPRLARSALSSPSHILSAGGRVMGRSNGAADGAGRAARRRCVHHVNPIATRGCPPPYPTAVLGPGPCHAWAQLHPQTLPIVDHVTANSHGLRARRVLRRPARAPVHNHHRQSRPPRVRGARAPLHTAHHAPPARRATRACALCPRAQRPAQNAERTAEGCTAKKAAAAPRDRPPRLAARSEAWGTAPRPAASPSARARGRMLFAGFVWDPGQF